jgi:hypothetical protein
MTGWCRAMEEAEAVEDINEGLDTEQQTHNTVF